MLIQNHINQKLIRNFFWVGVVKNGYNQSGYRTQKLTISQECTDGVSRFL